MTNSNKRVLILGGGFGGVYVAVHLGKLLSRKELAAIEIALVNRENYIVFQPPPARGRFRLGRTKSRDRAHSSDGA
jgi:NADH dehydrogenase FAD-containing subunit